MRAVEEEADGFFERQAGEFDGVDNSEVALEGVGAAGEEEMALGVSGAERSGGFQGIVEEVRIVCIVVDEEPVLVVVRAMTQSGGDLPGILGRVEREVERCGDLGVAV